jgi:uncharacterized protein
MIRLIMWIALIMAAIWFFKRLFRSSVSRPKAQPPEIAAVPMVRCAQCGVHLPQDRALSAGQQWYCSEPHRLQGPATRDR